MALADILTPSCVEVGKIKIGTVNPDAKKRDGGTYLAPVKLDHFWISTLHRNEKGVLVPDTELMESLKDFADPKDGKLRSLPVMFGSNDPNDVMTANYVWYDGKQLAAKSDGREVVFHLDPKTGARLKEPMVEKWHDSLLGWPNPTRQNLPLFKLYCTLNVMIASPAARWGGFYKFRTTSEISSRQLYGSLMHLRKLTGGVLRGLVFRMVVRPMLVTPNGQSATVHVVHVEYVNSDLKQLQASAREQVALEQANLAAVIETERQYKALVAAQTDEPEDDGTVSEAEQQAALIEQLEAGLADAATLSALAAAWDKVNAAKKAGEITDQQAADLAKVKDRRKAAIAPASPSPPPPSEPAGDAAEPATEPAPTSAKAGKAIVTQIETLRTRCGLEWSEVLARYGEAIGFSCGRPADLTPEQATKLHAELKQRAAATAPAVAGA
jgi:hypothetical protein